MAGVSGIQLQSIERYMRFYPQHDPLLFAEIIMRVDDLWRDGILKKQRAKESRDKMRHSNAL